MSQFAFLETEFASLHKTAEMAERFALSDPRGACFNARVTLEAMVEWLYRADRSLKTPYQTTLSALIHEASFRKLVGQALFTKAKIVKDLGNKGAHAGKAPTKQDAVTAVSELFHLCYWLVRTYGRKTVLKPGLQFEPGQLQEVLTITASTVEQIRRQREELERHKAALEKAEEERLKGEESRKTLEAELDRLRREVAEAKKANQAQPDTHDYNEAQTRDRFIDLLLEEAGWPLDQERDREFPVKGMPYGTGEGFVDYVLWGDDGKPLAVVEAKRTKKDARTGQQQAKLYADCLEAQFGRRPIIFYTNGYEHWLWDDAFYPPRPVQGFLKKAELTLLIQRRETRKSLDKVIINEEIAGRYYQTRAIRRVGESFEKDHLRKALLVMATGSGKTRTVIALVDQLMRANWVKRVLFLADRVALVRQAHNAFKTHLPAVASANLLQKHDSKLNDHTAARVCVSTYPTMMRLIEQMNDGARDYGTGHFDLVIIDEAHRSVYRKYRAIFDWFDSLLVGLTATPRDEIDRDTYSLFELEKGVPTDAYDLDDAVKDGYLVPPQAISVPLKFQRQGISYDDLSDEEKEEWDAIEWDEEGAEKRDRVEAAEVNKWLFNQDTVDKVLEQLIREGLKIDQGERLGKSIIFAKNSLHAQFIAERFDANYPHLRGQFARVIDYKVDYAQSLIDDFSDPKKLPQIAISVDMMDTGIDVPEVLNLVFFKIVRSKTKFWQMIGRGTRLCPDIFGPGEHKTEFRVFDYCQNFEFFGENPEAKEAPIPASLGQKLFVARLDLIGQIDAETKQIKEVSKPPGLAEDGTPYTAKGEAGEAPVVDLPGLRTALVKRLHDEVSEMAVDNFIVRPKRKHVEKFQEWSSWVNLDQAARIELAEHVAGLPSAMPDDEIEAKQFDYLILMAQLCVLRGDPSIVSCRKRIQKIADKLEDLDNVPMVAKEMALIQELLTDDYWTDVTAPMLETVRRRLRLLIKLIDPGKRNPVYTNFEDEIGQGTAITLPEIGTGTDKNRFMQKVRHFLDSEKDHITLQKIRRDEQLTPQDLDELQRMFIEAGVGAPEEVAQVSGEEGLGVFLRSVLGLDREAAKRALGRFASAENLTADQTEFIDLIVNHLTERGYIDPKFLYESPFTDLDDKGVSGVFEAADVKELVGLLRSVKRRAAA
ncbi:MAG: DEAD/DEAH box helicase family protein [Alphaproteobacteria bacterium]|nr:DEAD/DEAH box helicase family protein [Alphaproteobacteria bacterium]